MAGNCNVALEIGNFNDHWIRKMINGGDCYKISHRNSLLALYQRRNMEACDSDKALIGIGSGWRSMEC